MFYLVKLRKLRLGIHCLHSVSLVSSHFAPLGWLHRVGRVLSFSPVVGIGTPPTPHPQASVPPPVLGGGAHSLAREGLGVSQFRRWGIHCGTLYIYVLCGWPFVKTKTTRSFLCVTLHDLKQIHPLENAKDQSFKVLIILNL
jgi:hypothetical protein